MARGGRERRKERKEIPGDRNDGEGSDLKVYGLYTVSSLE